MIFRNFRLDSALLNEWNGLNDWNVLNGHRAAMTPLMNPL
jgi:hypothetical protein